MIGNINIKRKWKKALSKKGRLIAQRDMQKAD